MVRLEGTVDTDSPPDEIWALLVDFTNVARWDPTVERVEALSEGPIREGSRYRAHVRMGPVTTPMIYRVLVLDPPSRIVLEGVGWMVRAIDDACVEAFDGGTKVTWRADLSLRGPLTLTEPLWRPAFAGVADAAIDGLRAWLPATRAAHSKVERVTGPQPVQL